MDLIDRRAYHALPSVLAIKLNGSGLGVSPQGRGLLPPGLICTLVSSICIQYRGFTSLYKRGLRILGPVSISSGGLLLALEWILTRLSRSMHINLVPASLTSLILATRESKLRQFVVYGTFRYRHWGPWGTDQLDGLWGGLWEFNWVHSLALGLRRISVTRDFLVCSISLEFG